MGEALSTHLLYVADVNHIWICSKTLNVEFPVTNVTKIHSAVSEEKYMDIKAQHSYCVITVQWLCWKIFVIFKLYKISLPDLLPLSHVKRETVLLSPTHYTELHQYWDWLCLTCPSRILSLFTHDGGSRSGCRNVNIKLQWIRDHCHRSLQDHTHCVVIGYILCNERKQKANMIITEKLFIKILCSYCLGAYWFTKSPLWVSSLFMWSLFNK